MAETKIYINDLQDDATYNSQPQAFRLACAMRDTLSERVEAPECIRVFTPNKANLDLLRNNQYRFFVRVYGYEGSILVSGELVDQEDPRQLGADLAKKIWRDIYTVRTTPPPPAKAPSTPAP